LYAGSANIKGHIEAAAGSIENLTISGPLTSTSTDDETGKTEYSLLSIPKGTSYHTVNNHSYSLSPDGLKMKTTSKTTYFVNTGASEFPSTETSYLASIEKGCLKIVTSGSRPVMILTGTDGYEYAVYLSTNGAIDEDGWSTSGTLKFRRVHVD
jgi:hypothetical protein